jgi:hypothetical protein
VYGSAEYLMPDPLVSGSAPFAAGIGASLGHPFGSLQPASLWAGLGFGHPYDGTLFETRLSLPITDLFNLHLSANFGSPEYYERSVSGGVSFAY